LRKSLAVAVDFKPTLRLSAPRPTRSLRRLLEIGVNFIDKSDS